MMFYWQPIIFTHQLFYEAYLPQILPNRDQNQIFLQKQAVQSKNLLDIVKVDLINYGYHNNRRQWTSEEQQILDKHYKQGNTDWQFLLSKLPDRNKNMCLSKAKRLRFEKKTKWEPEEDQNIIEYVERNGKDWKSLEEMMPGKKAREIKERYENYLRENILKEPFSLEEDLLLIDLLNYYGKDWSLISKKMGVRRTQSQIKNRYFGRLLKIQERKQKRKEDTPQNS